MESIFRRTRFHALHPPSSQTLSLTLNRKSVLTKSRLILGQSNPTPLNPALEFAWEDNTYGLGDQKGISPSKDAKEEKAPWCSGLRGRKPKDLKAKGRGGLHVRKNFRKRRKKKRFWGWRRQSGFSKRGCSWGPLFFGLPWKPKPPFEGGSVLRMKEYEIRAQEISRRDCRRNDRNKIKTVGLEQDRSNVETKEIKPREIIGYSEHRWEWLVKRRCKRLSEYENTCDEGNKCKRQVKRKGKEKRKPKQSQWRKKKIPKRKQLRTLWKANNNPRWCCRLTLEMPDKIHNGKV